MADDLKKILLSVVLRQNRNDTTSPTNAFNLNNPAVQNYLTQKLKGILPNATGNITENELMTAWLLANSGGGSGTVTSVDISSNGTALTISGNPITTAGTIALDFNGANTDYVDGTGALQPFPTITSGTVTSVDLTMPSAFAVAGNPITTAGTLAVTGAGTTSQYIRGDGTLANFPTSTGGASVSYYLNGSVNQGTFAGNTYYEMNKVPVIGVGTNFSIAANGYIAQFITDANDPSQLNIPAGNWNFEMYFQASSGGGSPTFYVELYKWDGAAFTLIASSSTNPEGITNGTSVDLYTTALAVPSTTLSLTDRLAVRVYVNNSGRTITLHTEDNNLCQVITTFTTGLTALNGLTAQVQTFATGTTGTDFGIVSSGSTHTFNLPTASALNRGALSSADWTTFNNKQNAITPAALTKVDDTNVTLTLGGTPATALLQATSLTLGWSGQLSVARGGTGLGTLGTANQLIRVNAGGTALEYFTPTYGTVTSIATAGLISGGTITSSGTITTSVSTNKLVGRATAGTGVMEEITLGTGLSFSGTTLNASSSLIVGTSTITSGTVGRILFEGTGNVLQENSGFNYDTATGSQIIGGITARATRQTLIASSNLATSKTFVIRNAADSVDRFTFLGDGTYYSQPTQSNFNAGNILQVHIENNSAVNIGVSFLGSSRTGLVFLNNADSAIKLGLVQGGAIQPLFYSRWEQDFRGSNVRCLSTSSTMCGLTINNTGPSREWGMLVGNTSNATLGTGGFGLYDVTSSTYGLTINGSTLNVGIGSIVATARLHIRAGSATANTAPLKFTTGTNLTAAEAGAMEYNNTFHLTNSDAVRRHIVTAPNTTKVTAGAPYTNDGYITVNIGGTDFKLMTTA